MLTLLTSCGGGGSSSGGSPVPPNITGIEITPSEQTLSVDETSNFNAYAQYSDQQKTPITHDAQWTSSDSAVATIDTQGKVIALAAGKSNITTTYREKQASALLTIKHAPLQKIVITPENAQFHVGETKPYTATGHYSDNSVEDVTQSVIWSSTQPTTVAINKSGKATAAHTGSVQIKAVKAEDNVTGDANGTVIPASLLQITLAPSTITLNNGEQIHIKAQGSFEDGNTVDISDQTQWTIAHTSTATVSAQGVVTGKAQGTAELTATAQNKTAKATVNIKAAILNSIQITPNNPQTPLGLVQQYSAVGVYSDGTQTPLSTGIRSVSLSQISCNA